MRKMTSTIRYTTALAAALTVIGGLAFAVPAFATATDEDGPDYGRNDAPIPQKAEAAPMARMHKPTHEMNVESRIQTLHSKLKITKEEEGDWTKVAQTMRDNEAAIHQLIQARHENSGDMTAIDDLQSYQQITQSHADGLQKLITSFQGLYNDMSDNQKKNADEVFGHFEGHRDHAAMKKHSS